MVEGLWTQKVGLGLYSIEHPFGQIEGHCQDFLEGEGDNWKLF